jgi:hypothetical protein
MKNLRNSPSDRSATDSSQSGERCALLAVGVALASTAQAAEPRALDEDFLDYLSQLEDEQDDWTLFEADDPEPAAAKPAPKPPSPKEQPEASKPAKAPAEIKR